MLRELYIENIALIKKASVSFDTGLNVLTGETGAGKTILIGAIQAVLGERTSRDLIRTGEKKAVVSALFGGLSSRSISMLSTLGFSPDEDGNLLIQREIASSGNTCRINGMPATVSTLKQIGSCLLAIHGQFDTQALANIDSHRDFIDSFGELGEALDQYAALYDKLAGVREKLSELRIDESQKTQRVDFLTYQINEIASYNLTAGEDKTLTARRDRIKNAEKIASSLSAAIALIDGDESQGAADAALESSEHLVRIARYLAGGDALTERLQAAGYELRDICETLRDQMAATEFDPEELDEIESRLDIIYRLRQKYGGDVGEIIVKMESMQAELDEILFSDEHIKRLEAEETELADAAYEEALALSQKRKAAGKQFADLVERELADLDMPGVRLGVQFTPKEVGRTGIDSIEILFSANKGEELRPLTKIASGGEMSRLMLSIKNVLSGRDSIDTLIFDEIDTGVSGRAAHKIGGKLKQVSANKQILCVTHLAQVAAYADHHLLIEKQADENATFTEVTTLDNSGRIRELARITGGEILTEASLENAREMLEGTRKPGA